MRGIGLTNQDLPEWKKHVIGGKKSSFGRKTDMTLLEQRQSLPIYKLKDELTKVNKFQKPKHILFSIFNLWLADVFAVGCCVDYMDWCMTQDVWVIETDNLKLYKGCFKSNDFIFFSLLPDKLSKWSRTQNTAQILCFVSICHFSATFPSCLIQGHHRWTSFFEPVAVEHLRLFSKSLSHSRLNIFIIHSFISIQP